MRSPGPIASAPMASDPKPAMTAAPDRLFARTTAIGFAGRYTPEGPLDRQPLPVYAVGRHEAAPALLDLGSVSFLYVQEERNDVATPYLGIGAAVAPTTVKLPPPAEFPSGP